MPQREAKFSVNARPEELWRFLRDFRALCACIPGVERMRVVDHRTVELTVKEKIGAVPLIVDLTATIEREEPPRRLHALAKAEHLTMEIDVALRAAGPGTELGALFKVRGEGPLKPVVDRLFEKRATERAAQFADSLEKRFGAAAPLAPPGPPPAGRLRQRLARLWGRLRGGGSPPSRG
jgi:carbon monoxide dehydrogenase subunit G